MALFIHLGEMSIFDFTVAPVPIARQYRNPHRKYL